MKTLAERLVWAREKKGERDQMEFTQADLAARAGVSQGSIGHLESGRTGTSRKLTEIASVLGVDPRWLANGLGDPFPRARPASDETWIQRTNRDESKLLTLYRGTDEDGRGAIMATAELSPQVELTDRATGN